MVASGGEVLLVRTDAETVDLAVGEVDLAVADTVEGFPKALKLSCQYLTPRLWPSSYVVKAHRMV